MHIRRTVARLGAYVALASALVVGSAIVGASAANSGETVRELSIRHVDVSRFPVVRLQLLSIGGTPDDARLSLRENSRSIKSFRLERRDTSHSPAAVVLAIDTSGSMAGRGAIQEAKAAARSFITTRSRRDRVAIIAYSDTPHLVSDFSDDTAHLLSAVDALTAGGNTALWDAAVAASRRLATQRNRQRFLVVLSDASAASYDNHSSVTANAARDALKHAGVTAFTVGLPSGPVDDHEYRALASSSGGIHITTTDVGALSNIFNQIQGSIQHQYELTYRSHAKNATLDIRVGFGTRQAAARVKVPRTAHATAPRPTPAPQPSDPTTTPLKSHNRGFPWPSWKLMAVLWLIMTFLALRAYRRPQSRQRPQPSTTNRSRNHAARRPVRYR